MLVTLASAIGSEAAEWTAEPAISFSREYHDNIGLSLQPKPSVLGSIVSPSLNLGVNGQVWRTGAAVSGTQRRYSGQSGLDRDDYSTRISSVYKSERHEWQLGASQSRISLLSYDIINADTGVEQTQRQTRSKSITPSWSWMYSETTLVQVAYQWNDVSYEDTENTVLSGYRYQAATVTLSKQLSELNSVFVTGGYSIYHVPDTGFDSDTLNMQFGASRKFSETALGSIQAGLRNTKSVTKDGVTEYIWVSTENGVVLVPTGVTSDATDRTTSSVFSGSFSDEFESTDLNLSFSRALNPSGSGGQVEQDSFNLDVRRRLTALTSAYLRASYYKSRSVEGNISDNEQTFFSISPGAIWEISREWNVEASYKYSNVKRGYEPDSADSNSIILKLNYRPYRMSISR